MSEFISYHDGIITFRYSTTLKPFYGESFYSTKFIFKPSHIPWNGNSVASSCPHLHSPPIYIATTYPNFSSRSNYKVILTTSQLPNAQNIPMASINHVFALLLLATLLSATFNPATAHPNLPNLVSRLQANSLQQCWDSLMELRSCSGEVILFFLNGEMYLGPSCCRAIQVIEHQCWAADAMLAALGFTVHEGDILRGYCDASTGDNSGTGGQPSPVASGPADC
jgi:Prolamin-like